MALSIQFPMILGKFGFASYADDQTISAINQNLKMLLLTNPGEYVMDINFGAGLYKFLFEMSNSDTQGQISQRINSQVSTYMPYVVISSIDYDSTEVDNGALGIGIRYKEQFLRLHIGI